MTSDIITKHLISAAMIQYRSSHLVLFIPKMRAGTGKQWFHGSIVLWWFLCWPAFQHLDFSCLVSRFLSMLQQLSQGRKSQSTEGLSKTGVNSASSCSQVFQYATAQQTTPNSLITKIFVHALCLLHHMPSDWLRLLTQKKQWKWLLSWLLQELKVQTPEIHLRKFFVSITFNSELTLFWKRENSQNQPSWEAGNKPGRLRLQHESIWFWYTIKFGIKSGRPLFAAIIAPFSHTRPSNDAAIWHRRDIVLYRSISSCVVCIEVSKQYPSQASKWKMVQSSGP